MKREAERQLNRIERDSNLLSTHFCAIISVSFSGFIDSLSDL